MEMTPALKVHLETRANSFRPRRGRSARLNRACGTALRAIPHWASE